MENSKVEIAEIRTDVKWIRQKIKEDICPQVRENTKFRQQARGIIGTISFISLAFGGFLMWIIDKIRFWERGN